MDGRAYTMHIVAGIMMKTWPWSVLTNHSGPPSRSDANFKTARTNCSRLLRASVWKTDRPSYTNCGR